MKKTCVGVAFVALTASGLALATPAQADGLGGISGWQPPTEVCGTANLMPVVATNATNQTQTLTINAPAGGMSEQVRFMTSQSDFVSNCPSRNGSGEAATNSPAWTQTVTVDPGTSQTFYLSLGGVDYTLLGNDAFTISGGTTPDPIQGSPIPAEVTFTLDLGMDEQYESLSSYYGGLGSTSVPGFNLLACNTESLTPGGDIYATSQVLTPYAQANGTPGPTYGSNQPMCMGWIPVGTYLTPSAVASAQGGTVLAVVTNQNGLPAGQQYAGVQDYGYSAGATINTSVAVQVPSGTTINQLLVALNVVGNANTPYPFTQIGDIVVVESMPVTCGDVGLQFESTSAADPNAAYVQLNFAGTIVPNCPNPPSTGRSL